jgi:VWFA-related protein
MAVIISTLTGARVGSYTRGRGLTIMKVCARGAAAMLLAGLFVPASLAAAQTAAGARTVYISALDNKRVPVTGLTAADFTVKEAGKTRDIVKVEAASAPMQIAIVIDDDDQGGKAVHTALESFVKKMTGRAEIALLTTRGGAIVQQDFTTDANKLAAVIEALPFVRPGVASMPIALLDVSQALGTRHAARPVIIGLASPGMTVASTIDGPDGRLPSTKTIGATVNPSSPSDGAVTDAMRRNHVLFYMVHLDTYQARGENNEPPEVHYSWPLDAPAQTGGRTDRIVTAQGLVAAFERIADELLGQYAMTYQSPDAPQNASLDIDAKRKGVTVRAPQKVY